MQLGEVQRRVCRRDLADTRRCDVPRRLLRVVRIFEKGHPEQVCDGLELAVRAVRDDLLEGMQGQQSLARVGLDHLHDHRQEVVQVTHGDVT